MYFVTTAVVDWQFIFTEIPYFEIIIESLNYCIKNKGLHLHGYVIMPNHVHYIIFADDEKQIPNIIRDFNTHTSREITGLLKQNIRSSTLDHFREAVLVEDRSNEYKVWQDSHHPIAIQSQEFFKQKLNYLHENPVRKGYIEQPEYWKYSSARNYLLDDHSIIEVECLE